MKRVLLLCVIFVSSLYPQQTNSKSVFISLNLGIYDVSNNQFNKAYNSNIGFLPGITIGLPFSTRTYLYGKASYFSKDGVPVIYTYDFQNGKSIVTSESKGGTAKFREWIYNIGLLYNIFLSEEFTLGVNGGIVFANTHEEQEDPAISLSATSNSFGLMGLFGGCILERNFDNSPFSIIGELQYNFSRKDVTSIVGNNGGLNVNLGGRFYFGKHRRQ